MDNIPRLCHLEQLTGPGSKTVRIIDSVAPNWEELAMALGFDGPAIKRISRDYSDDCREACSQMLTKWLGMEYGDTCKTVSWTTFIQCLKDADFSCVAIKLEGILGTHTQSSENQCHIDTW